MEALGRGNVVAGSGFLLGLAASAAMSKMGDGAKDVVFSPNGYEFNKNGITSDSVEIDANKGIIKIKGTDIDIDASKLDVVDWENGVFKNYDGSVDIDLLNNKYIDEENGIFVDPSHGISAVLDGEHFENIAIPDFDTSFGSGKSMVPWDNWNSDSQESKSEPDIVEDGLIKTISHKLDQLFNANADTIEDIAIKDIFGNEIVQATDAGGDTYLTSVPKIDSQVFEKVSNAVGGEDNAISVLNNIKLEAYMQEFHPNFGTRVMVYEGGPMSGIHWTPQHERYNSEQANEVIGKIAIDGGYYPDPGSPEAINFVKFQNAMLESGAWDKPMISPNMLLDANGDGKPDVDLDGDGRPDFIKDDTIDFTSKHGFLDNLTDSIKDIWPL